MYPCESALLTLNSYKVKKTNEVVDSQFIQIMQRQRSGSQGMLDHVPANWGGVKAGLHPGQALQDTDKRPQPTASVELPAGFFLDCESGVNQTHSLQLKYTHTHAHAGGADGKQPFHNSWMTFQALLCNRGSIGK